MGSLGVGKKKHFSDREIADFRRDGFLVVRGMYGPEEMRAIVGWTDELLAFPEVPGKYMMYFEDSLLEPDKRVLSRVEDFCPYHEEFAKLINEGELPERVSELFGEPAVLFKDKINCKMPGGDGFTPHQDVQAGWGAYAGLFITALAGIDEATPENGCLELVAGHHEKGLIGELWRPLAENDMEGMEFVMCPIGPGDAVFFDSFVPHRSGPNLTGDPRRALYLTYNRLSEGDHRIQYYVDKRKSYPPDCEREPGKKYVFRV